MRLEYVRLHNVGPFDDFEVDLTAFAPEQKLIAVTGPNGRGKTFLLEAALPGAAYRRMPSQGSLLGRARARDACVEVRLVNGQAWTIRHELDAISRKGETIVLDEAGQPAYEGASVKSFDAWAKRRLPSEDVLYSTLFAAQRAPKSRPSFIELDSADRISVILQAIGVARLEQMAELARKRATEQRRALEIADARLADERARGGDLAAIEAGLLEARDAATLVDEALERRRGEFAEAQRQSADADRAHTEWRRRQDELRTRRENVTSQIAGAKSKAADLEQRITNNRNVLAEREGIEASVRLVAEWTGLVAEAKETWNLEGTKTAAAEAERRRQAQAEQAAQQRLSAARRRADAAQMRLGNREAIEAAQASIPGLREATDAASRAVAEFSDALEHARASRVAGAEDRIVGLRGALQVIADGEHGDEMMLASNALAADDQAVKEAAELPERLRGLEEELRAARNLETLARRRLTDAEVLAARAPELENAEQDLAQAQQDADAASAEATAANAAMRGAQADMVAHDARARKEKRVVEDLTSSIAKVQPQAAKAEHLARADARLAELEPQLDAVQVELARLEQELIATPAPDGLPPAPGPALAPYELAVRETEAEGRRADQTVATMEHRLEQARAAAARLAELDAERSRAGDELSDWNRIASDLGRDGLQSAEVDSAGPELTELVNELLHSCHGPRFTVSIETSRLSSDGKKQIDECRVQVIDTVAGREGEAREFSGGERVILGEAVSLALTLLACRRAGVERPTLVRDESGAALDPENGRRWIAMLRRAIDLTGADRLLFVAHNPELVELADARVEIA